ncbi:hypothetical protein LR48_Vigan2314s000100 [Vigna angularis]|nr:hypothetical protein LR48_Vigan2314s000100 [Vigna angularis]
MRRCNGGYGTIARSHSDYGLSFHESNNLGTVLPIQSLNRPFLPNTRPKSHFSLNNLPIFHSASNPFRSWSIIVNLGFSRRVSPLSSSLAKALH